MTMTRRSMLTGTALVPFVGAAALANPDKFQMLNRVDRHNWDRLKPGEGGFIPLNVLWAPTYQEFWFSLFATTHISVWADKDDYRPVFLGRVEEGWYVHIPKDKMDNARQYIHQPDQGAHPYYLGLYQAVPMSQTKELTFIPNDWHKDERVQANLQALKRVTTVLSDLNGREGTTFDVQGTHFMVPGLTERSLALIV